MDRTIFKLESSAGMSGPGAVILAQNVLELNKNTSKPSADIQLIARLDPNATELEKVTDATEPNEAVLGLGNSSAELSLGLG